MINLKIANLICYKILIRILHSFLNGNPHGLCLQQELNKFMGCQIFLINRNSLEVIKYSKQISLDFLVKL